MKNLKYFWLFVTCLTVGLGFAQEQKELENKVKLESVIKDLNQDVHLIAEVSKIQVAVDGELNIEYRLYVSPSIGISGWEITEKPSYEGFDFETIKLENLKIENTTYKGKSYRMVVLRKDILKATKSGDYDVAPLQLQITAEVADATKKLEELKFSMQEVTTTIVSNTLKINVKL